MTYTEYLTIIALANASEDEEIVAYCIGVLDAFGYEYEVIE